MVRMNRCRMLTSYSEENDVEEFNHKIQIIIWVVFF